MKPLPYQNLIVAAVTALLLSACTSQLTVSPKPDTKTAEVASSATASVSASASESPTRRASNSASPSPKVVTVTVNPDKTSGSGSQRVISNVPAKAHSKAGTTGVPSEAQTWHPNDNGITSFRSPTGNIGCDIPSGGGEIVCMLQESEWPEMVDGAGHNPETNQPTRVRASQIEYRSDGQTELSAPGGTNNAFDSKYATRTLPYGQMIQTGSFVCASEQNGVTCWNTSNGHGVFINRSEHLTF